MKIIAHRGNDNLHKENTLKAILNSLNKEYIDGVEFDIRMTKDYKFIINHDPFYKGFFIRKTKAKALRGLDNLEEVLSKIKNQKILLIEIKEETSKYKILCAKLNNILKKYNLNYYIFSFNYNLIKYFKEKYPNYNVGLLIGVKKNLNKEIYLFDFIAINYRHIDKKCLKETFVWTINNIKEFEKVKKYENIITDKAKYIYDLDKSMWQTLK